jgi:hypothetical protein
LTEDDYDVFDRTFRRIVTAFRLKLSPVDLTQLARVYFQVLESATLDQVLHAAKVCLEQHKRFPTAADWRAQIETPRAGPAVADHRWMTPAEIDDLAYAAAVAYAAPPCGCDACTTAGVSDRPLRFVPTVEDGIESRAFNSSRNRVEVLGHWAHGAELARWYAARDRFFALAHGFKRPRVLHLVGAVERDPGEEG